MYVNTYYNNMLRISDLHHLINLLIKANKEASGYDEN